MTPEVLTIETFLKISGPYGVIGALLFILWSFLKGKDKDISKLATAFEAFLPRYAEQDAILKSCQQAIMLLGQNVAQNGHNIEALEVEVRQALKTRGGRAGM